MDYDTHANLRDIAVKGKTLFISQSSPPSFAIPPMTQAQTRAIPGSAIRLDIDISRCETENPHRYSELSDGAGYRPHHQEQKLCNDVSRLGSARSSTWSSSTTIVSAEPVLPRWRVRRGIVIVAEAFLQVCSGIYPPVYTTNAEGQ
jgi:hypothetical protein